MDIRVPWNGICTFRAFSKHWEIANLCDATLKKRAFNVVIIVLALHLVAAFTPSRLSFFTRLKVLVKNIILQPTSECFLRPEINS